jgi:hypothetical protein
MGEPDKHYCLISTPSFQVTAHYAAFKDWTIMDQIGVMCRHTGLFFDLAIDHDRQVVWHNHQRVQWSVQFDGGGALVLSKRTVVHLGRYLLEVVWCDHHGDAHPKFGELTVPHLDLYCYRSHHTLPEETKPHGLLGVTSRGPYNPLPGGEQGEGVLDVLEPGSTFRDYETANLWDTGWKFSQYSA